MADMDVEVTVAAVDADATAYVGGQVILQTALGFGTAYGLGEAVWGGDRSGFLILTFLTGEPAVECFGPDANDELVSLGTLPAGWSVSHGDPGRIEGGSGTP